MSLLDPIQDIFRRYCLKKDASTVRTGITALDRIRTAVTLIDSRDPSAEKCRSAIQTFYWANGIAGEIFALDLHKMDKEERQHVSDNTLVRTDLNWFGRPAHEKVGPMFQADPDLFICLVDRDDFPVEYIAKVSPARFKIGRRQLRDEPFDIVVNNPESKQHPAATVFDEMVSVMQKIR